MSVTPEQIIAALKKIGPASPTAIAAQLQADKGAVGRQLRAMLGDQLNAAGKSRDRIYALPEQKLEGARSAPGARPKKPGKKKGGARKARKVRRARAVAEPLFIPTVHAESRLVLVTDAPPLHFTEQQTVAIATLLGLHYGD